MSEKDLRIKLLEEEVSALRLEISRQNAISKKNDEWSQRIIDSLPNPVFIKNKRGQFISSNKAFEEMMQTTGPDLLGKTDFDFTSLEESLVFRKIDEEVLANGVVNWNEEKHTMGGVTRSLLTSKTRIEDANDNYYILGVITDITDNKNQLTQLVNKKKEVEQQKLDIQTLLKEVHHRVKNNLQIIISLLNLQKSVVEDEAINNIIVNTQNRIYSMAKTHEILCENSSLSAININGYIKSLVNNVYHSVEIDHPVHFEFSIPNIYVSVDTAIPPGLIINEVITNSIKYGKVSDKSLEVYVNFTKKGKRCTLAIGDNGEDVNQHAFTPSLGAELISIFTEQLGALLEIPKMENGVHYSFNFLIED